MKGLAGTPTACRVERLRPTCRKPALQLRMGRVMVRAVLDNVHSAQRVEVRRAVIRDEEYLKDVARLRAKVYYESQAYTRFVESFQKQFAQQELRSLRMKVQKPQEFACILAIDVQADPTVVGCADLRLPSLKDRIPDEEPEGSYLCNLCVDHSARRLGVAKALICTAVSLTKEWQLASLFAHVACDNTPAMTLYLGSDFIARVGEGCAVNYETKTYIPGEDTLTLGQNLLLVRSLYTDQNSKDGSVHETVN